MTIRTVIVEEDAAARAELAALLANEADVELIEPTPPALADLARLGALQPDLVFLNVETQSADAPTLLAALRQADVPAVVVVARTARHALAAFDAGALDYLLKPFQPGRLRRSLERVRQHLQGRALSRLSPAHLRLLEDLEAGPQYWTRIPVRDRDRVLFVPVEALVWAEAAENYVLLHTPRQNHIVRLTLGALEAALNPEHFCRISRSALINLAHLAELRPLFKGRYLAVLRDGTRLPVTRSVEELERLLKYS
jgi:two-component system LytT family response regulator